MTRPPSETEPLKDRIRSIAKRFGLLEIYVFGSRAAEIRARVFGEPAEAKRRDSDVDIGVRTGRRRRLSAEDRVQLAVELEDLFEVQRVDVVVLEAASPFLALDVIRGDLLYSEDADAQAKYELYVLRRAADLEPFERLRIRQILTGEPP